MLRSKDRRFFSKTTKSARTSDEKIMRVFGAPTTGCVLVTYVTPCKADEDVFEGHRTTSGLKNQWVVAVLLDQIARWARVEHLAVVDDGDPVADRLGFLHRVSGQEDASPFVT